jgi:hypothetical protein
MADYDANNPYVREAVAAGVPDTWIASFLRRNPNDYHRIMAAASGDDVVGKQSLSTALTLADLSPAYQTQVRPSTALAIPPAPLNASLGAFGGPLFLAVVAVAAYFIYKKL